VDEAPRYATLRDYVAVVRRYWIQIALVTLAFGAAALALSLAQTKSYRAEASLAFKDTSQDLDLLGTPSGPSDTPEQRAAVAAETVDQTDVLQGVKKSLKASQSVDELRGMVSAQPEARTNLVVVQASSESPSFAAALAQATANQVVATTTASERRRLQKAVTNAKRRLHSIRKGDTFNRDAIVGQITRLQALADFAQPVQIVKSAAIPSTPVSPRPVRNTALGLVLGAAIALLLAFGRAALDRRLRSTHEIEQHLGLPLVGQVGRSALGTGGRLASSREPLSAEDLESFRMLRSGLQWLDVDRHEPPRKVLVTSALPEEGKTTVAACLAYVEAESGARTVLVDCDMRRSQLAERLGAKKTPGLGDYIAGRASYEQIQQSIEPHESVAATRAQLNGSSAAFDLKVVTVGTQLPNPSAVLASDRVRELLSRLESDYDVVVIDSSPLLPVVDTLELLPQADAVLLCVRASRTTRDAAATAKQAVEHLPKRPMGIVVTGVRPSEQSGYGAYVGTYSYGPAARASK
jgi:capsular exopolysaccharide synthesis family protein